MTRKHFIAIAENQPQSYLEAFKRYCQDQESAAHDSRQDMEESGKWQAACFHLHKASAALTKAITHQPSKRKPAYDVVVDFMRDESGQAVAEKYASDLIQTLSAAGYTIKR
jgi:hypothetical protein